MLGTKAGQNITAHSTEIPSITEFDSSLEATQARLVFGGLMLDTAKLKSDFESGLIGKKDWAILLERIHLNAGNLLCHMGSLTTQRDNLAKELACMSDIVKRISLENASLRAECLVKETMLTDFHAAELLRMVEPKIDPKKSGHSKSTSAALTIDSSKYKQQIKELEAHNKILEEKIAALEIEITEKSLALVNSRTKLDETIKALKASQLKNSELTHTLHELEPKYAASLDEKLRLAEQITKLKAEIDELTGKVSATPWAILLDKQDQMLKKLGEAAEKTTQAELRAKMAEDKFTELKASMDSVRSIAATLLNESGIHGANVQALRAILLSGMFVPMSALPAPDIYHCAPTITHSSTAMGEMPKPGAY